MSNKILSAFDVVFAFFGAFWAGLVFFRALALEFNFIEWILVFSIMVTFLFPLIRKALEVFLKRFEYNYKNRAKKRWNY